MIPLAIPAKAKDEAAGWIIQAISELAGDIWADIDAHQKDVIVDTVKDFVGLYFWLWITADPIARENTRHELAMNLSTLESHLAIVKIKAVRNMREFVLKALFKGATLLL